MLSDEDSLLWELCEGNLENMTEHMIFRAVEKHDLTAEKIVKRYIRCFGTGITNITNIFRPDLILLSGSLFMGNQFLLEELHAYIARKCFGSSGTGVPDVKAAEVGDEAGLIGAANLI